MEVVGKFKKRTEKDFLNFLFEEALNQEMYKHVKKVGKHFSMEIHSKCIRFQKGTKTIKIKVQ